MLALQRMAVPRVARESAKPQMAREEASVWDRSMAALLIRTPE